ncbi:MAG: alkyl sulfatase dimerization domain-containing protein [Candidatus Binatia bacterium]|nr:alkyl sulfatase dimerization domain-containing protein [Candidatus Binatia bacterium]
MGVRDDGGSKPASAATRQANEAVAASLPLDDPVDFEFADRGFLATSDKPRIEMDDGRVLWDFERFSFLSSPAPDTVNPSLWRQANLNARHGLFEVAEGIYQVRGFDLANVTFIRGKTGWIVIDPLTCAETARAALELVDRELGKRPIHTVIYTHSHIDHFGGVRGVVTDEDVAAGRTAVVAPEGFLEAAVSENVIAGAVMGRRATYMYGNLLPTGPQGHVDAGLGKGTALGSVGLIAPTESITATGAERVYDGVEIVFQMTPNTEAPAEMNFYFPQHKSLCMAENCTATLHNLYTPRGAQVRDSLSWSKYIDESIELFADSSDSVFASHHWPRWGRDTVRGFLTKQRDLYRYIHDQSMRMANQGETMLEIAEQLEVPDSLGTEMHARGYYGTLNHNAKAVYQRYLGWFDGNPAHLHGLPPVAAGKKYVEFMGGAAATLEKARAAFEAGEYRWVAEVVNHVVFADPDDEEAKGMQADALEQMGYQAESGPWRSFYLSAAQELRHGIDRASAPNITDNAGGVLPSMSVGMIFDSMAVRLNGPKAADQRISVNFDFTDTGEKFVLRVENGALSHTPNKQLGGADATMRLKRTALDALILGRTPFDQLLASGDLTIEGKAESLLGLFGLLDNFDSAFPIVTP